MSEVFILYETQCNVMKIFWPFYLSLKKLYFFRKKKFWKNTFWKLTYAHFYSSLFTRGICWFIFWCPLHRCESCYHDIIYSFSCIFSQLYNVVFPFFLQTMWYILFSYSNYITYSLTNWEIIAKSICYE